MKKITLCVVLFILGKISFGQVSGNVNYDYFVRYPENYIDLTVPLNSNLSVTVKGLANLTADSYVAIFSVTQVGKTTEEVNQLMDNRINEALAALKSKQGIESFIDMISFVPVYEYEVEKKVFSKKTYNEVPKGFELKKNIHIKYKDPNLLNEIIAILSKVEIFDLVRVDYFSEKIEKIKLDLISKAKILLLDKIKNYKQIMGANIDSSAKKLVDGFKIVYPVEMYRSYQAFSSSTLNLKKSAYVNPADKSTTLYYQPVINKEFDFVINSAILEPVIQVMYEIKLEFNQELTAKEKEYLLIAPNGEIKKLEIKK